ncbi:hypothetical protein J7E78_08035 [Paenibacillus polymyxa]|uniref:hypothetical protein n=1 Tax=Paenibacillus polymyxa TaxID=1406 RepID=UPI001BE90493|nr:hypothetical protein [Paenibacillus polymyxa]MBT2283485.1 hypothetical protein [Paenibacillus polymyxa]
MAWRRPALPLPVRLVLAALLALARPALPALPTTLPVLLALPARTLCAAPADVPPLFRVLRFPDFTPLTPADPVPAAGVPLPINTAGWMPRGLPDTEALTAPVRVTTLTPFPPLAMHEDCRCAKRRSILPAPAQSVLLPWGTAQRQHQSHIF